MSKIQWKYNLVERPFCSWGQVLYFNFPSGKAFAWPDRFGLSFPAPSIM